MVPANRQVIEVLVVEDSATQAMELEHLLETNGHEVTTAKDGENALRAIGEHRPSIILSDIVMPNMDGYEFCRRLKANPATSDIPVILLTALHQPQDILRGLECGADNFIIKPWEPQQLLDRLNFILSRGSEAARYSGEDGRKISFMGEEFTITSKQDQVLDYFVTTFEEFVRSREREHSIKLAEARKAAAALAELAAIVESSYDAIIGEASEGVIKSWNQGAERVYGYTAEEMVGRSVLELAPADRHEEAKEILDAVQGGAIVNRPDTRRLRKDGTEIDVSLIVSPVMDAEGEIVGSSSIVRDITEQKKAERELREFSEDLTRSNEELQQFARVASHELQEPLRLVSSYVQLLEKRYKSELDADADEFIGYAVEGVTRMSRIINDLLAFREIGERAIGAEPTHCEIALRAALAGLETTIRECDARVTHDPLPKVRAESAQLVKLFEHLIGNALKFRGQDPPVVHVGVEANGGEWTFSIRDNGIGIEPQYTERIFRIFQRLHGKEEYPGTGIGLAISKKIVERYGGNIWVESKKDEGSTFYFTLPEVKQP